MALLIVNCCHACADGSIDISAAFNGFMHNEFVHKSVVNTGFLWYAKELEAERAKSGQLRKELGMVDQRGYHTNTGAPSRGSSAAEPSTRSSTSTGTCSTPSIPEAGHDPDPVRNLDAEGALDDDVMKTKEQAPVPPARKTTSWYAARAEALHGVKRVAARLGGMKQFTSYIVDKLKEGITKKSGAHSTSKVFGPEIVQQIIADPEMRKVFTKAIDADRKPPVSRFRFATTRLPPRKESTRPPMKKSLSGTSDGRTEALLEPYVDPYIEQCKYDSKLFKPAIDTCHGDPNVPVTELGLVRMPVLPEHFQRTLPGALWNKKWGPFTKRLGLCIIHGLMRTGESNFEGCTMLLRTIFAGNGKTRTCASLSTTLPHLVIYTL